MASEEKKKAYNEYVERITPNNNLFKDMWNAFWIAEALTAAVSFMISRKVIGIGA